MRANSAFHDFDQMFLEKLYWNMQNGRYFLKKHINDWFYVILGQFEPKFGWYFEFLGYLSSRRSKTDRDFPHFRKNGKNRV